MSFFTRAALLAATVLLAGAGGVTPTGASTDASEPRAPRRAPRGSAIAPSLPSPVARAVRAELPLASASRSIGLPNRGRLEEGVLVEESDVLRFKDGTPEQERWATEELARLVRAAAAHVAQRYEGAVLTVGDLSRRRGGRMAPHRSHRNGRDVDLLFYGEPASSADAAAGPAATDPAATGPAATGPAATGPAATDPAATGPSATDAAAIDAAQEARAPEVEASPGRMVAYGPDGAGRARDGRVYRFDDARNWALVARLLEDRVAEVQHIFVHRALERRILDEARRQGAPEALVARADAVMSHRGGRHHDHMHVRILCPEDDRPACRDLGVRPAP